ncbi:MAG: RluA family pseudouridine synthase [Firmicutes bacterium]|nr:RluA family pseudouridine synthase [Bacillota bacterium]
MAELRYTAEAGDRGKQLKTVIKEQFSISSRLMTKLRRGESILVNGKPMPGWVTVFEGDQVEVRLPEEKSDFEPEDIPLDVVFEDEWLMVINKQAGIVAHPTKGNYSHTLLNGITYRMLKDAALPDGSLDKEKLFKVRLTNRLDMNTSGLVIVAKHSYVQEHLIRQMEEGKLVKHYTALLEGLVEEDEGAVDLPIGLPDENFPERWILDPAEGGYPSLTEYKVIKRYNFPHYMAYGRENPEMRLVEGYTLMDLRLRTGRTHQIRVHMSQMGHPVVGDHLYCHGDPFRYREEYGTPEKGETNPEVVSELMGRQALHASSLSFTHPVKGEEMFIEAELPEDMKAALGKLEQ